MKKEGLIGLLAGFFFGLILFFGPGFIPTLGEWTEWLTQLLSLYSSSFIVHYLVLVLGGYLFYLLGLLVVYKAFIRQEKISFKKTLLFFAGFGIALVLFLGAAFTSISRFRGF